jgi:hypothetical protein
MPAALAAVSEDVGVLVAHRHDFPPILPEDVPFHLRMIFRQRISLNSLGRPLLPKRAHRATPDIEIGFGNHSVSGTGLGHTVDNGRIEILHFPVRSYAQLERKVINGGGALILNTDLPSWIGSTWRHLHEAWRMGELPDYYDGMALDHQQASLMMGAGDLILDTRVRDVLTQLGLGRVDKEVIPD